MVREYDEASDAAAVRRAFIELQDFEREIDPRMPPGEAVADRYLRLMFDRCAEFGGRGRGIGRTLLEAAEARAREAGADCVRLSVKAGNAGARSLYAAEGYEATDIYLEKKLT